MHLLLLRADFAHLGAVLHPQALYRIQVDGDGSSLRPAATLPSISAAWRRRGSPPSRRSCLRAAKPREERSFLDEQCSAFMEASPRRWKRECRVRELDPSRQQHLVSLPTSTLPEFRSPSDGTGELARC